MIAQRSVTSVHFVPSMLDAFLAPGAERDTSALRWVFAAGEALSVELVARFHDGAGTDAAGAALINWYGPAEATVVTACRLAR